MALSFGLSLAEVLGYSGSPVYAPLRPGEIYRICLDVIKAQKGAILAEFNVDNVREFIVHQQERPISPYTVQGKVRTLKAFSSWLFDEGYAPDNVLHNIKLPKVPTKIVDTLSPDEIETLIGAQNPLTSIGSRNIAILVTLLDTGLRCSELSDLLFEDAHIEEGYVKVVGKGTKERLVPLGKEVE